MFLRENLIGILNLLSLIILADSETLSLIVDSSSSYCFTYIIFGHCVLLQFLQQSKLSINDNGHAKIKLERQLYRIDFMFDHWTNRYITRSEDCDNIV